MASLISSKFILKFGRYYSVQAAFCKGGAVSLSASRTTSALNSGVNLLRFRFAIGSSFNSISLKADEIGPRISLDYHYDAAKNHRDASLFLLAGEGANGKASASITLEDKFGNTF